MKHNKRSDRYQKNKYHREKKRICPACLMNFIRDPDEKLCEDCINDICDGLIDKMEDEEQKGEQV